VYVYADGCVLCVCVCVLCSRLCVVLVIYVWVRLGASVYIQYVCVRLGAYALVCVGKLPALGAYVCMCVCVGNQQPGVSL